MTDHKHETRPDDPARAPVAGAAAGSEGGDVADVAPGYSAEAGGGPARAGGLRDTAVNTVESVGAIGGSAVGSARDVLRGAIGATEDVGSGLVDGVAHLATDVVHGVRDVGVEVKDGANVLIGAVGELGGTTIHTVAHLLADVMGGVREVVGAAVGSRAPDGEGARAGPDGAAGVTRERPAQQRPPAQGGAGSSGANP